MDKEDSSFFREEARVAEIDATKGPWKAFVQWSRFSVFMQYRDPDMPSFVKWYSVSVPLSKPGYHCMRYGDRKGVSQMYKNVTGKERGQNHLESGIWNLLVQEGRYKENQAHIN